MNFENFKCLMERLTETGFHQDIQVPLRQGIEAGLPSFSLDQHALLAGFFYTATIQIKKWRDLDLYYCWKFHGRISKEGSEKPGAERDFYFGKLEPQVNLEEGFHLLNGGSIYRDPLVLRKCTIPGARAWLDFSKQDASGNFFWAYSSGIQYAEWDSQNLVRVPDRKLSDQLPQHPSLAAEDGLQP